MHFGSPLDFDNGGNTDDFRPRTQVLLSSTQRVHKKHPSRQVPVPHALCTQIKYSKVMLTCIHAETHTVNKLNLTLVDEPSIVLLVID